MEKMLTSDEEEMSRFMTSSPESAVPESERQQREAYHYSKVSLDKDLDSQCTNIINPVIRDDAYSCGLSWIAKTAGCLAREHSISRLELHLLFGMIAQTTRSVGFLALDERMMTELSELTI